MLWTIAIVVGLAGIGLAVAAIVRGARTDD